MHPLDEKDIEILGILKKDSQLTTRQISKKMNMPITTVHHRIKKLEQAGVIKGYTVILDNEKLGRAVAAYILVSVDYKADSKISQASIAKKIKNYSDVEEVAIVTGTTDILVKVRMKAIGDLNHFVTDLLRNIEGVDKTQTMVVLQEIEDR